MMNTLVATRSTRRAGLVAVATLVSAPVLLAPLMANAAEIGATVYGGVSVAFVSTGASTSGGKTTYGLTDNVSLLGVKGDAAVVDGTKFFFDYNAFINATGSHNVAPVGAVTTHLGIVGIEGPMGTVAAGRDNGLFVSFVDGPTYQTNWYYTPGMSNLQVADSIKYVTAETSGFQAGVQAFNIGKGAGGESTTNYTFAGKYAKDAMTFGAGYSKYSDYADGTTQYSNSPDGSQFGTQNVYNGLVLKSVAGVSAGYKMGAAGIVAALDSRKPAENEANTNAMNTIMVTGNYMATDKVNLVANISNTKQKDDGADLGVKGNIVTLMASYAPAANVLFTVEFQSSNEDANKSSLTGATGAGGTKSSTGYAFGASYSF